MKEIITKLFDLTPEEGQREMLKASVSIANRHLSVAGINLTVTQPSDSVKPERIPPKKPGGKSRILKVNGRQFPSIRKACSFYGVNYETTAQKIRDGYPLEELFKESDITRRRAAGEEED